MQAKLLDPKLLRKLLRYDQKTGKLFWRERNHGLFAESGYGGAQGAASKWNARFANKEAFITDSGIGYKMGRIFGKNYKAHRVIWALVNGEWPSGDIDHINGIRDDNRIDNLRDVCRSENNKNRAMQSNNSSGYNGVFWFSKIKKWCAYININGERVHLGSFEDLDNAIIARKVFERENGFTGRHGL